MSGALSHFKATQGSIGTIQLSGTMTNGGPTVTVAYDHGQFTLDTGSPGGPLGQVRLLDDVEQKVLLGALEAELKQPPAHLDQAMLEAFVHLLKQAVSHQPSALFDDARFAEIERQGDQIIAHVGFGIDMVGTIHDHQARFRFERHVVPMPPAHLHSLTPADRASLKVNLARFFEATPDHDPLYDELLKDASRV